MILLDGISFSYPGSDKLIFDRLCLEVPPQSFAVVAGPDGAGKSTLAKIIKGLLVPQVGNVLLGCDHLTEVGYVSGDPYESLVGVSVEEDVVFGLETLGVPSAEMEVRLAEALQWTGLIGMEKRLTHTLSGGEQQKAALAGMLAAGCRILVLDDALAMLDRRAKRSIRALVESLRHVRHLTVLECTNDLDAICAADRVVFLIEGQVEFDGSARAFLQSSSGGDWRRLAGGVWHLGWALSELGALDAASRTAEQVTDHILHYISI
ncbi:MAG: energy-coupling factor ABC transporter ATP-binding protein [Desulfomonile sp.]|nr:energy-coupling factor ABC transporter ATP-binding protein [Desulfomonile sp.]